MSLCIVERLPIQTFAHLIFIFYFYFILFFLLYIIYYLYSSIAGSKMMPPPSVSRLWARGIFYRLHWLAFLDFYFFYYSQRLRTWCYEKKTRYPRDPRRAPLTNLYRLLYPSFYEFLLSAGVNCFFS